MIGQQRNRQTNDSQQQQIMDQKRKTKRIRINWKLIEENTIRSLTTDQQLLVCIMKLQEIARSNTVPYFYTYFLINKIGCMLQNKNDLRDREIDDKEVKEFDAEGYEKYKTAIKMITQEIDEIVNKISKWHKIQNLISKRQKQLLCIHKSVIYNKSQHAGSIINQLNEIVGVTYLIIKQIQAWYEYVGCQGQIPIMYEYNEQNYLVKIGYDNIHILNVLNIKICKFRESPNPFFMVKDDIRDDDKQEGVNKQEINWCMQILQKQKQKMNDIKNSNEILAKYIIDNDDKVHLKILKINKRIKSKSQVKLKTKETSKSKQKYDNNNNHNNSHNNSHNNKNIKSDRIQKIKQTNKNFENNIKNIKNLTQQQMKKTFQLGNLHNFKNKKEQNFDKIPSKTIYPPIYKSLHNLKANLLTKTQKDHIKQPLSIQKNRTQKRDEKSVRKQKQKLILSVYQNKKKKVQNLDMKYEKLYKMKEKEQINEQIISIRTKLKNVFIKQVYGTKILQKSIQKNDKAIINHQLKNRIKTQIKNKKNKNKEIMLKEQIWKERIEEKERIIQKRNIEKVKIQQLLSVLRAQKQVNNKNIIQTDRQVDNKEQQLQQQKEQNKKDNELAIDNNNKNMQHNFQAQKQLKQKQLQQKQQQLQQQIGQQQKIKQQQQQKLAFQQKIKYLRIKKQQQQLIIQKQLKQKQLLCQKLIQEVLAQQIGRSDEQGKDGDISNDGNSVEQQQIGQKILKLEQQANKQLILMLEQVCQKNKYVHQTYETKLQQLKNIELEVKAEQQELKELQSKLAQLYNQQKIQQNKQQQNQQNIQQQSQQDIEMLKLKLKQEILQDYLIKNKQRKQMEKIKMEQYKQKLYQEMGEQVAIALRKYDQEMEVLQNEQALVDPSKQIFSKREQGYKNEDDNIVNGQAKKFPVQQTFEQIQNNEKMQQIRLSNNLISSEITQSINKNVFQTKQLWKQNIQVHPQEIQISQPNEQSYLHRPNIIQNNQQQLSYAKKPRKQYDGQNKNLIRPVEKQKNNEKLSVLEQKFRNLQPFLKQSKQIYIEVLSVAKFITTFFEKMKEQQRQMIAYNPKQLQNHMILSNKKVDIWQSQQGYTIGWLQQDRYIIIGSNVCVNNIMNKYGNIQIQKSYNFNKGSIKQRIFIVKQIQIYKKIGYVYQRKIEQNIFSIKFIIKIPLSVVNKVKPVQKLFKIQASLKIDQVNCYHKQNQFYLDFIAKQLSYQKNGKNKQNGKTDQKVQEIKIWNDSVLKCIEIDQKILQIQIQFEMKYIQTNASKYYVVKSQEFTSTGNLLGKIYVTSISQKISLVLFQYHHIKNDVEFNFIMKSIAGSISMGKDTGNDSKIRVNGSTVGDNMKASKDILLCVPIWHKTQTIKSEQNEINLIFKCRKQQKLNFGSILRNHAYKQPFKQIQPPFVFSLFENGENSQLIRPLIGNIVNTKDLIQSSY